MQAMKTLYTATAIATGDGRNGHVQSSDGLLEMDVRMPKEMGGPGGATNPEQLFAAGYAACFHSALRYSGARMELDTSGSEVTADVSIGTLASGGFGLAVQLQVHLPALDGEAAAALAKQADLVCPYSNATRGNIDVTLTFA
jgi:lipoyl-dependent peroxiredoxin